MNFNFFEFIFFLQIDRVGEKIHCASSPVSSTKLNVDKKSNANLNNSSNNGVHLDGKFLFEKRRKNLILNRNFRNFFVSTFKRRIVQNYTVR